MKQRKGEEPPQVRKKRLKKLLRTEHLTKKKKER